MIELLKRDIQSEHSTVTYSYISFVHTPEHQNSLYNQLVYEAAKIENSLEKLLHLNNGTEIIVIADHGQIPINDILYMDLNKYDKFFYAYPAIGTGTSTFFVKKKVWKKSLK